MRGFAFGPGTAPRLFAYSLMALGFGVMLVGLLTDGPPLERFTFIGPFGGAVLVIALIPIYYFATRIGTWVPGVAPDIVVAAVGATTVVVLAFLLTQCCAARAAVHHRRDAHLRHHGASARPRDRELRRRW